ncbi:MAG: hypothetical protein IK025_11505 [Bacteroidales bacterium]|nr:hypothetical protein [Bacteroidales bacterium]
MNKIFVVLVLSLLFGFAEAQDFVLWSKDVDASVVEVDRLGNIYLVRNNTVAKYDAEMNFICAYDNYPAGSMSSLDVSNPFKVIVFYSEFNKLIYLDSKLAELLSPLMLDDAGLYNIKVVCSSSFGGFWVFDGQNSCVRRVTTNLEVSQQGTNIYDRLGDADVVAMRESINYLFLLTDDGKVLILDKFGNFYRAFEIDGECSDICIENDILYYSSNGVIIAYDVAEDKSVPIPTNGQKADKFRIRHDLLYLLVDNKKLECCKIQIEK